jgi:hypothetical protein
MYIQPHFILKKNFMKTFIKLLSLSLLFIAIARPSFSQKNKKGKIIEEAHITYSMTTEGEMAAMMSGSSMDLFFTPNNVKLLATMMNGVFKMDVRMDNKKNKGFMLMDILGKKNVVEMGEDEINKSKPENQKPPKVVYTKKYKKIAGYKCQEARVSIEGIDEPAIVYITEKIKPSNLGDVSMLKFTGLKGFPLSWQLEQQGLVINMVATMVSLDKLPQSTFDMTIPEGYEKMDIKDLNGMGNTFGM